MNDTDYTELADRYIEMWNTQDQAQRRDLIARTFAAEGTYLDPLLTGEGRDGIEAMIATAQPQFGHFRFRRTGPVDSHHNRIRFTWELSDQGADIQVAGIDFGVVNEDGLLESITGFFDRFPGSE